MWGQAPKSIEGLLQNQNLRFDFGSSPHILPPFGLFPYGASDPRYAAIDTMSPSFSCATGFFISCDPSPARSPL